MIATIVVLLIFAAALPFGKHWYDRWKRYRDEQASFQEMKRDLLNAGTLLGQPSIPEPIFFQYIDGDRVKDLYSQIEPEMLVKQRKVADEKSIQSKVGVSASGANAEVGGSAQRSRESTEERIEFSTERKCQELMRFAVERKNSKLYKRGWDWFLLRLIRIPSEEALQIGERTGTDPFDVMSKFSPDQKKEVDRRLNLWDKELEQELTNLKDTLVFIEGHFIVDRGDSHNLTLVHIFVDDSGRIGDASKTFRPVRFRVSLKTTEAMTDLMRSGAWDGRVFGFALRPLRDDGFVEVTALAVY